jgi:transposase-like protein
MVVRDACPACGSTPFKKNGHIHSGKQTHQCTTCGRQCVASAEDRIIAYEQRTRIEHLLRERLSRRGLCRAVGGSLTWLLHFMVERFAACPEH